MKLDHHFFLKARILRIPQVNIINTSIHWYLAAVKGFSNVEHIDGI